jgi:3-deoxy-D-manno-octulosonate 8-phosphate phosphatase (KDO 8-P phosphatase)
MLPVSINIESLDTELISRILNIRIMVFDFDGVFTDNRVYVSQDGTEAVSCWRSDGLGLSKIKKLDIPIWVVSKERNPVVAARCEKLKINYIQGCDEKLPALIDIAERYNCKLKEMLYVGNDINDIDCLQSVGLPIVVQDSYPEVKEYSSYITQNPGGRGAVREVCDIVSDIHIINTK